MADNETVSQTGDTKTVDPKQSGTDPSKTVAATNQFDPSTLKDDDFAKLYDDPRLYNHPKFKELNEARKKAKEYETAEAKRHEDELIKQKKYEELLAEKNKEIENFRTATINSKIDNAITSAAVKKGIIDPDAAMKLIDRSKVSVDDAGNVVGASEAIDKLAEERSYLLSINRKTAGSATNPASTSTTRFKMSDIRNTVFYRAHEKEIQLAIAEGRVDDD